MKKITPFKADLMLMGIALIWGSTFIITKQTIESIPPITFNSIRFIVASLFFLTTFLYRPKKINKRTLLDGLTLGFVLFLTFTFQTIGLKFVTASETGFITGLYLIFVPILSVIFLKKTVEKKVILAIITAFTGLFLISYKGKLELRSGEILVIANAFFVGVHIILTDFFARRNDPFALTSIQIFALAILSFLYALIFEGLPHSIPINIQTIFAFFLTGVMATVVAFLVQTYFQKFTTPTRAAVIFTLEPLSSAFFGFIIGGEVLSLMQYFGACLIFIAMLIVEIKWKRSKYD